MQNNLGIKLIAVLDIKTLKLFQAQGLKIMRELSQHGIHSDVNHRPEKREGLFQKRTMPGMPGSEFDPHTDPKDVEHQESSARAEKFIKEELGNSSEYKELIIVADPKMLGFIKHDINSKLKKILKTRNIVTREIKKDLVNHDIAAIEKAVFA